MPKVVKKQGFLGFGRPLETWYCDRCGVECENRFCSETKMYCLKCANEVDPEIVHNWTPDYLVRAYKVGEFFEDSNDGQKKYVEACSRCLGLVVVRQIGSDFIRDYYRLGSSRPTTKSFACIGHPGYNQTGNVSIQAACVHNFIAVATSKRTGAEANAKYKHLIEHRNTVIEAMFGANEIDIQYHCFGATHFWCGKCGLHYHLNPQREHLLPHMG